MASLSAIETAFGQRLDAATALPIVWPNKAADQAKPYVTVQHVPTGRRADAIAGNGSVVARGYFMVAVVTEGNTFATAASTAADDIVAQFPMGLRLTAGNRVLQVSQAPEPLTGFPDGADWRQPVRISYQVTDR